MSKGICTYPLVACRKEPNERSEMVSQLLYGESYQILENNGAWLHIKNERDTYESWIDLKLHTPFPERQNEKTTLSFPFYKVNRGESKSILLPGGALLDTDLVKDSNSHSLIDTAIKYLDTPYLWGGKSVWGIDCSGFVQVVFQMHGIDMYRDAYQQAELGEMIEFNVLIEKGDLAFFSKEEERISHVGICLGEERIIHASGKVRIDKLDHNGIFNEETNAYSHELRVIKRIKKTVKL
jgi:hypothetical protein